MLAQRLVRVACRGCSEATELSADLIEDNVLLLPRGTKVVTPRGCSLCRGTGYRGRTGIFEALEMTDEVRDLVKSKATVSRYPRDHEGQQSPFAS